MKIVNAEGGDDALQVAFVDGSSLFCIVWTDWRLLIEHLPDRSLPDYFWPVEDYASEPVLTDFPEGGLEVVSVAVSTNEVDDVMGVEMQIGDHIVSARSFGGEILISTR